MKNDSEAFTKMEKYIDHMDKKGFHLGIGSIVHIYFLALQLGNIEYGLKFLSQTSRVHRSLYCNLLVLFYILIYVVGMRSPDVTTTDNKN